MRVKSFFISVTTFSLLVSPLMAGQPEPDTAIPNIEMQQKSEDCRNTGATLVKLAHFVDLWRDANLEDEGSRAKQYEMEMLDVLRNDIRQCMAQMDKCKQKLCGDFESGNVSTVSAGELERARLIGDMHTADSVLKAKKRLLGAISHAGAFSNKYRLLGDYMELLRRELDRNAVKVALNDEDPIEEEGTSHK